MTGKRKMGNYGSLCLAGVLLLLSVAGCSKKEPQVAPKDRILMVHDTLYYGTEETGPMGDADCVEGEIQSTVEAGEIPTENGQSNFGGVGNPYTFAYDQGGIMVFVDDAYFWFYKNAEGEQEKSGETKEEQENTEETAENVDLSMLPLNFVFASGAGAWGTMITLEADGSFTGGYNDSDMGDTGEGYAHGKHYYCEFQGRFGNFRRIDEHTYGMTLEELTYEPEAGTEEIRDEILYVASEPYGLETGKEFLFYLPETPVQGLSEEFLIWWPGRYAWEGEAERPLACYGIQNVETGYGFFSDEVSESGR